MRDTTTSAHAALTRHPWAAQAWVEHPPTPALFRYMEARLACLRRADFPGLTAKEIARIERGEVKKPRERTLAVLAKRLGVPADKIRRY